MEEEILKILRKHPNGLTSGKLVELITKKLDCSKPTALKYIRKLVNSEDIFECYVPEHKQKKLYILNSPESIKRYYHRFTKDFINTLISKDPRLKPFFQSVNLDEFISTQISNFVKVKGKKLTKKDGLKIGENVFKYLKEISGKVLG